MQDVNRVRLLIKNRHNGLINPSSKFSQWFCHPLPRFAFASARPGQALPSGTPLAALSFLPRPHSPGGMFSKLMLQVGYRVSILPALDSADHAS